MILMIQMISDDSRWGKRRLSPGGVRTAAAGRLELGTTVGGDLGVVAGSV